MAEIKKTLEETKKELEDLKIKHKEKLIKHANETEIAAINKQINFIKSLNENNNENETETINKEKIENLLKNI